MSRAVIVGVAQVVQRPGEFELERARGPIELMVEAARAAAEDAGVPRLLERVGWVGVAGGWFRYLNPGQVIAETIGCPMAATAYSKISGTAPQEMLGVAAERIACGQLDVALIVGGEARWSHQRTSRAGHKPAWNTKLGHGTPEVMATFPDDFHEEATALGAPAAAYALFEDRLRVMAGETVDDHRDRIASLWAHFSEIASTNPFAWDRRPLPAAEIRNPTADNRMVAFPYTKAMVANNTVDLASAVLLCHPDMVNLVGANPARVVYPHAVTSAHETWKIVHRDDLGHTPGLSAAGRAAFEIAGIGPDDVTHVDLYACFPSIVQMSAASLGFDVDRDLTVTGGLGFAGGSVGNAVGQSIAAIVDKVRGGGLGLVHANGGNATKHSFAVYSSDPPERFVRQDCQPLVDLQARPEIVPSWAGEVTIEAATVLYDRDGPSHLLAAVLDRAGHRALATARDADLIDEAVRIGVAGRPALLDESRTLRL